MGMIRGKSPIGDTPKNVKNDTMNYYIGYNGKNETTFLHKYCHYSI